jgi:hypothetical protein
MDKPVLGDPSVYPTEEVLSSHLGRSKTAFEALLLWTRGSYPDLAETWKYYKDGKSWHLNVTRKKKILFWLSVGEMDENLKHAQ